MSFIVLLAVVTLTWLVVPWTELFQWANSKQQDFQNAMARALQAIRRGDPQALWLLCGATAAYGVVHAIGPGHGKVLIGGAALASGVTFRRLAVLTVVSSLAQSLSAILLIAVLVFGIRIGARDATDLTETWLAPISIAAIGAIGALLLWRGLRYWYRFTKSERIATHGHDHHNHTDHCGCGHAHGPSVEDVKSLETLRDAVALVLSIAIRPCTGALFVLVIAARFDAFAAGCLAVLTMGMGTAAFNLIVAGGGTMARHLTLVGHAAGGAGALRLSALFHVLGGGLILSLSCLALLT